MERRSFQAVNKKGQALFEFLIFLPFTFMMVTVFFTMGNSINASINQQKVVRGYYYYDLKNNTMAPTVKVMQGWNSASGLTLFSSYALGWSERAINKVSPVAACYKANSLLMGNTSETCEEPTGSSESTSFIRLYTVYGLCLTPFQMDGSVISYTDRNWGFCGIK